MRINSAIPSSRLRPAATAQPAAARSTAPIDTFTSGPARAVAAVRPAQSPYWLGRIRADGRQMVGDGNQAFTWRGVSEFLLPQYLNDTSRSPAENEAIVARRMDERVAQGYSVLRMFGTVAWEQSPLKPFDNWEQYKSNAEKVVQMAKDRGLYVEWTALTDVGQSIPKEKTGEYIDFVASMAKKYDNTFVEIANESFKNGLSDDEVFALGQRFKSQAPEVMLAGSSPSGDSPPDGGTFGKPPFDYVTLHPERADGDDGYRWVRHLREGEAVSADTGRPVVQDEPIGSASEKQPGRRDDDPVHFRDAALVAAITGQGFTFHTERAVTKDPNAPIGEPGADQTNVSDLIPADARGTHFVNGHWDESPFDAKDQLDKNVLRVFTRMNNDGSGFYTYPVDVKADLDLRLKSATHLKVTDIVSGRELVDRDFAAGEVLHLQKGSDVLITGGNAAPAQLKHPIEAEPGPRPPPPPPAEPVPAQRPGPLSVGPPLSREVARERVERLYRAVLGREADPGGLEIYTGLAERGSSSRVVNALVGSVEFRNHAQQLSPEQLTDALYRELLDRAPDPGGAASTAQHVRDGNLTVRVLDMLRSDEYRARE